jgi:hypothetical protein
VRVAAGELTVSIDNASIDYVVVWVYVIAKPECC